MTEASRHLAERMKQNAVDILGDIITDLWVDWVFDSGDSTVRDRARYLERRRAKCKGEESSFGLGRVLGEEWAPSCRTRIKNANVTDVFEQIQAEELPPLFKEVESRLKGSELEVFRQGFVRAVRNYQDVQ